MFSIEKAMFVNSKAKNEFLATFLKQVTQFLNYFYPFKAAGDLSAIDALPTDVCERMKIFSI